MGARSMRQRAAARSAKRRASASPAPTEGTTLRNSSVPVEEEQIGAPTKEQSDPLTKPRGHGKKTALGHQRQVETTPTRTTRNTKKNPPAKVKAAEVKAAEVKAAEVKGDQAEAAPDGEDAVVLEPDVLPERPGRKRFTTLLAQIAEEPEFSEADRSIGNFELPEQEWENWKAGPGQLKDEYDSEEDSSEESDT
jgi:hypothetical protein